MLLQGRRFTTLCQDLFALAQAPDEARGPERGWRWERRIADHLGKKGFPVEPMPGGIRVFGVVPASGLRHQTDAAIECVDAHVIGEWKAYSGPVPKNEVLRFKAATDDLYDSLVELRPRLPVIRLFGVCGDASDELRWYAARHGICIVERLRWYAARHGICIVERSRWLAPVLGDLSLPWGDSDGPGMIDRQRLRWLCRPLQRVYPRMRDGSLRLPRRLPDAAVVSLLEIHDHWSDRLWDHVEDRPGAFEDYVSALAT
jgi:hypothetical protein